jgi:putative component of membrane protein insertase Oxa1/YidC/SpoIIIJ protein YidD
MQVYSLDPLAKTMAINSITAYQKYISPRKGFSCSHRRLHGGESCSNYIKRILIEQNLAEVLKLSLQRFKDCTQAGKTLAASNGGSCIIIPCCLPL